MRLTFPFELAPWSAFAPHALSVAVLLGTVAACGKKAPQAPPPPEVTVVTVQPQTVTADYEFVGQAAASRSVDVRSSVTGVIVEQAYTEGTDVPKGTVLFRLDPTVYEAAYRSAQARLAEAEAQLNNTQRNLARLRPLLLEHAVAQKDVDDAETAWEQAQAQVAAAQASVDRTQHDYEDTWIRAEIPGRVGRAQMVLGARVTGPTDLLTNVDEINPIFVYFSPSDQEILRWRSDIASRKILVPPGELDVEVTLSDGSRFPYKGKLNFINLALQPQTGTLQLRAEFRNPQRTLLPGQFVRVRILGVKLANAILVPQTAVQQGQGGAFVYVVDAEGKATARDVVTSAAQADQWIIESGLKPGEQVVVEGVQKVISGQPVRVAATDQRARTDSTPGAD